jgi:NADPH-dependent 2,4-dienoyl-CoA reductase/sulfur reductase-like enzyme
MAASLAASRAGASVALIDRNGFLGGILPQCIHDGFGLIRFGQSLTGPEYAERFTRRVKRDKNIEAVLGAMVTRVTPEKSVYCVTRAGIRRFDAASLVFATGCRERARGALGIPGTRPAGVFTAGTAQQLVNVANIAVGKRAVVLGSGDVGLIMARRLTLCGVEVACVLEKQDKCGGLLRNKSRCLDDFGIPLLLRRTVTEIRGRRRLESVLVSAVDSEGRPLPGSQTEIACDTLILSVGLIPENEIALQLGVELLAGTRGPRVNERLETTVPGVFSCGNALHVSPLVDDVSSEGEKAGSYAASWARANAGVCLK